MIDFQLFISAVKSMHSLRAFVIKGDLVDVMNAIGHSELKAAGRILKHIENANQPREAINRALVHVESAHENAKSIWENTSFLSLQAKINQAYILDQWACSMMAICHKILGDQKWVNDALIMGKEAIEGYLFSYHDMEHSMHPYNAMRRVMDGFNPRAYYYWFKEIMSDIKPIDPGEYEQFCREINKDCAREAPVIILKRPPDEPERQVMPL